MNSIINNYLMTLCNYNKDNVRHVVWCRIRIGLLVARVVPPTGSEKVQLWCAVRRCVPPKWGSNDQSYSPTTTKMNTKQTKQTI